MNRTRINTDVADQLRHRRIALILLLSLGLAALPLSHPVASTPSGDTQSPTMQPDRMASLYWDNPRQLTSAGGLLFFTAFEPATGWELWKSDGTPSRTELVKDIIPGPWPWDRLSADYYARLIPANDSLYYLTSNGGAGQRLYKTDGTPSGTILVTESSGSLGYPTAVNDNLYFVRSDGDLCTGNYSGLNWMSLGYQALLNNELFFVAHEWAGTYSGPVNFWKTDGTLEGTRRAGENCGGYNLLSTGKELYYLASSPENDIELYQSSGGPECGRLVKVLIPRLPEWCGKGYRCWVGMTLIPQNDGATILTVASTGSGELTKLWATDGTESGTVLLANLPHPDSDLVKLGDAEFLLVRTETELELMRTDGTAAGTQVVKSFKITSRFPTFLPLICFPG